MHLRSPNQPGMNLLTGEGVALQFATTLENMFDIHHSQFFRKHKLSETTTQNCERVNTQLFRTSKIFEIGSLFVILEDFFYWSQRLKMFTRM